MKNVIVTIDTEGHQGSDPVEHLIIGKTPDGQSYGIPKIMDLCDTHNIKALFFVDMAEAWDFGKEKIQSVIEYILDRGHDVGVHIHPDHMADKERLFLYEYTIEEQTELIGLCTDLYKEITGKQPLAFRAGKYGLNHETLDVLSEFGYRADFSAFYKSKWCGLNPPITINRTFTLRNGIVEFPVTVYRNYFPGLFDRIDKLDINMGKSEHEYVLSMLEKQNGIDTISVFAHSFSFLKWRQDVDHPEKNEQVVRNFAKMLSQVEKSQFMRFANLNELLEIPYPYVEYDDKSLPSFSGGRALFYYGQKAMRVLSNKYYSWKYGQTL